MKLLFQTTISLYFFTFVHCEMQELYGIAGVKHGFNYSIMTAVL